MLEQSESLHNQSDDRLNVELFHFNDEAACPLTDEFKHKYTHHISVAVSELLQKPMFSHVKLDDIWDWKELLDRSCVNYLSATYDDLQRSFVDVNRVAIELAQRYGLWCRIDERILKYRWDTDVTPNGNFYSHWWIHGCCNECSSKLNFAQIWGEDEREEAVKRAITRRKMNFDRDEMLDFIRNASWMVAVHGWKASAIANTLGCDVRLVHAMKDAFRCRRPKHEPPKTRNHMKWKAAYDALREMGINI